VAVGLDAWPVDLNLAITDHLNAVGVAGAGIMSIWLIGWLKSWGGF
jgi:hypothetical protein